MSTLRKAAEMALEALESVYGKGKRCEAAIKELRRALAEPVDLARVGEVGVWGQKREWVGLTDEDFYGQSELQVMAMKYAETKLKEKNT